MCAHCAVSIDECCLFVPLLQHSFHFHYWKKELLVTATSKHNNNTNQNRWKQCFEPAFLFINTDCWTINLFTSKCIHVRIGSLLRQCFVFIPYHLINVFFYKVYRVDEMKSVSLFENIKLRNIHWILFFSFVKTQILLGFLQLHSFQVFAIRVHERTNEAITTALPNLEAKTTVNVSMADHNKTAVVFTPDAQQNVTKSVVKVETGPKS